MNWTKQQSDGDKYGNYELLKAIATEVKHFFMKKMLVSFVRHVMLAVGF